MIKTRLLNPYKTVSKGLIVLVILLASALFWQMSAKPADLNINKPRSAKQLLLDFIYYSDSYINLTESEAIAKTRRDSISYRVIERDGKGLPHTDDRNPTRANFTVRRGIVAQVEFY